jgi:hypothetical protein
MPGVGSTTAESLQQDASAGARMGLHRSVPDSVTRDPLFVFPFNGSLSPLPFPSMKAFRLSPRRKRKVFTAA